MRLWFCEIRRTGGVVTAHESVNSQRMKHEPVSDLHLGCIVKNYVTHGLLKKEISALERQKQSAN